MTANPEQSAMEKVRQRWPGAKCIERPITDDNGCDGFGYRIEGTPLRYLGYRGTEKAAWLDAASRLEAEHE